ncbi:MAG: ferredoxin [Saccharospirillaceae bacterium]|nr:hypothetical protein [Pseudomonadales bacterium]NRB80883.1 ferredoxin [Saccharospirillaceae bacterium]
MNPNRTSQNVDGDFYTTGYWYESEECGDCLDCAIPEAEAPTLLADIYKEDTYTHFIRQPESDKEIEQACEACEVCCVNALRYGGTNIDIIQRLYNTPDYCDYLVTKSGGLEYALDEKGDFLPFSYKFKNRADKFLKIKYGKPSTLIHRIISLFKS